MVRLARNCADLGDLATALSWCEQAVAADRLNPAWHYLRAAILQEQEAQAEAALSLRKAIYLDQDFVMAHFALGNLALRRDDARGARRHFDERAGAVGGSTAGRAAAGSGRDHRRPAERDRALHHRHEETG